MTGNLREWSEQHWHEHVTHFWGWPGTTEQKIERLLATPDDPQLRARALALMCASFPPGRPPSRNLVTLMKRALGIPDDHAVGDREDETPRAGRPADLEARLLAEVLDREYYEKHSGRFMSLGQLAKKIGARLDRSPPSAGTLREWRDGRRDHETFGYRRQIEKAGWPAES